MVPEWSNSTPDARRQEPAPFSIRMAALLRQPQPGHIRLCIRRDLVAEEASYARAVGLTVAYRDRYPDARGNFRTAFPLAAVIIQRFGLSLGELMVLRRELWSFAAASFLDVDPEKA